jgi:catechol 2,3-dioxygenase-like lactoylglutathione lyase family enzyme
MESRVNVITLAVANLERALRFYRDGLGFASGRLLGTEWTDEATGANGAIVMFELDGGLILSLYLRSDLAKDAEIPVGPPQSGEFSLAQLVHSRVEVDQLLRTAESAGAAATRARDRPWGIYSGYFRDPDGHLWEIIHHPSRVP